MLHCNYERCCCETEDILTESPVSNLQKTTQQNGHEQSKHEQSNGHNGYNSHIIKSQPHSEAGKHVSEAVYWRDYYEHPEFTYEWNNGILEEKPMADVRNSAIYQWVLTLLRAYLEVHPIAQLVNLEIGFRLALPNKVTIRKPDLFAVRHDNAVPIHGTDRNYRGIVDLAIESLSDSTKYEVERDTVQKRAEYEGVGVQEYYILDASDNHMAFYQLTEAGTYAPLVPVGGDVIRSTVLPGFQFRISDLHRQPGLLEMALDPLYQTFVLPDYQIQKSRAERLAAKLRELGIPEEEL